MNKKVQNSGLMLIGISLFGKIFGLAKQLLIAYIYGADQLTDIYFLADSGVSIFGVVAAGAISISFLSNYSRNKSTDKEANRYYITNTIMWSLIIATIVMVIVIVCAPLEAKILAPQYNSNNIKILIKYIRVLSFSVLFIIACGAEAAALEGENIFWVAKIQNVVLGISSIVFVLCFSNPWGVYAIIFGYLMGFFIHMLIAFCVLKKNKLLKLSKLKYNANVKAFFFMIPPIVVGNAVVEINNIIDKSIASGLEVGAISALYYGQIVSTEIVAAVLVNALGAVFLAKFSTLIKDGDIDKLNDNIKEIVNKYVVITVLLSLIYVFHGNVVVGIVYGKSRLAPNIVSETISVIRIYSLGFVFIPLRDIYMRIHYAFLDSKIPMFNCILQAIINLVCSLIFVRFLGVSGIALGTTIAILCSVILLKLTVKKYIGNYTYLDYKSLKSILIAMSAYICISLVATIILHESLMTNLMILIVSVGSYLTIAVLMKNKYLIGILNTTLETCHNIIDRMVNKRRK